MDRDWQPIDTVPNSIFDVLAKRWDASLDKFIWQRFANCFKVDDDIILPNPFRPTEHIRLIDNGFRPEYWMSIPDGPAFLREKAV